ncbi:hypothetical protein BN874_2140011 [Candidatus Contendobacter odensis Run_B_J11]|uniref:Uncharacterized protein n=1 Tax=Candidatus Contendobacter odensis Run_B_J11 TaxID=1400861 RepID=A0A7U7GBM3_9GAMM|nr:hypothetical protein BN874_2140011 [Candidatus Contendobacter odensis Run_B_J11]
MFILDHTLREQEDGEIESVGHPVQIAPLRLCTMAARLTLWVSAGRG